jgi:RimJ/RimL family protein N-acetyltransferase
MSVADPARDPAPGPARDPERAVPGWTARPLPEARVFTGRHVRLAPLAVGDAGALHAAFAADPDGRLWDYMAYGPFPDADAYAAWVATMAARPDPMFFTVFDRDAATATDPAPPGGVMSLLRLDAGNGVAEVGHICLSPALQRRRAATEAQFLLMRHLFDDLGYRRYEWKCNAANAASRRAALRLGFSFEGVFRNHMVVKGRNRDTAWFALTAEDWPTVRAGFEAWLAPDNFDADGRQRRPLAACRAA